MNIELRGLDKKDYKKAASFAITGMHFNIYLENRFLQMLYAKYFLFSEMLKATQIIAAYCENEFAGLLIAQVKGEPVQYHSFSKKLFVNLFEFIQKIFFKSSAGEYDQACKAMLDAYKKENNPDGEIIFLAADPHSKAKGIGTALLNKFESREKGKQIYLFTDDMCTYQFYEHRGFDKAVQKNIVLQLKNQINLQCMLFSKRID